MAEHVNETRHDGTTPPTAFCTAAPLDCLFGSPSLYQDPVDTLSLTQKSDLPETQQRGGWSDHAHPVCQQATYTAVNTAISGIGIVNFPAPVLEDLSSDPPHVAPSSEVPWPNQNLRERRTSDRSPRSHCSRFVKGVGVRSTHAATGCPYPRHGVLESFYPAPTGIAAPTSNGWSQGIEKRPRRASTLQEARQFLVELERKWGPKRSTWFSKKDAEPLHDLLARFQKDERKRIKSLLSYSGNTVESIQTTILRFEERMQNKRGFIGQYDPQSGQDLSLLLEDYLVVKISDRPKYITSSCGRSKCDHCSKNMSGNSNQGGRSWQHVMICLSSSLQGNANVWTCFESECSKSFSSSENLARHRLQRHPDSQYSSNSLLPASPPTNNLGTLTTDKPTTSNSTPIPTHYTNTSQTLQLVEARGHLLKGDLVLRRTTRTSQRAPPQYLELPMPTLNMQLPAVSCLTPTGPSATSQPSGPPFFPPLYPPHRQSHSSHHSNERDFPHLSITSGTRMPQPYWVTNSNGGGYGHGSTTPTAGPQSTFDPLTRPAMACLGSGARQVEAAVGPSEGLSRPSSYPIHTIPVAPPHGPHYPHNAAAQMLPLMNSGSTSALSAISHTISNSGIKHRPGKDMARK